MAVTIVYPNKTGTDLELGFYDGVTLTSLDIFAGAGNSSKPQFFVNFGNQLIFEATDASGRELWITDGTAGGTHQIKDINPGAASAFSDTGDPVTSFEAILNARPAVLNGLAFFGASDSASGTPHGLEPWVTDGTNGAGTHMLLDIRSGATGSGAHDFVTLGSFVYFIANDGTHDEVWKTDGTTTSKVTTLSGGATSGPEFGTLTASGSNLFFVYNDGVNRTLYVLDGTAAGAHAVPISPIPGGGTVITTQPPFHLTDVNGTLYFGQYDTEHGNELWTSDGTTATFIKNIGTGDVPAIPIFNDGNPENFVAFNSRVYFVANDGTPHGREVWKTDGTEAGTVRVTDINTSIAVNGGNSFFFPQQLIVSNNALYFAAINNTNDFELYKLDTSDVLTKINVNPGGISSTPFSLVDAGGNLYFAAQPGAGPSFSLFRLDGLTPTPLATDYSTAFPFGTGAFERFGAIDTGSAPSPGTIFFTTWKSPILADRFFDHELGVYDGVNPPTIINIFPGNDVAADDKSSQPTSFAALGGKMYFWADGGDGNGYELWVSDGTAGAGTHLFLNINPGAADSNTRPVMPGLGGTPFVPLVINNVMYFRADDGAHGLELWRSDGTVGGTFMLTDIRSGAAGSSSTPTAFTDVGGTLYFFADDGNGQEIWKSDGTGPGTARVTNIGVDPTSSYPDGLVNFGGQLAFRASNDALVTQNLYVTDGVTVTPLLPAGVSANSNAVVAGGKLFFSANQAGFGPEPWVSDGTPGGTHRIDDLRPGNEGSNPLQITVVGSNVFFMAFTNATGVELFKWDSSSEAPSSLSLVKNLNGNDTDSFLDNLINVDGTLFFTADPDGPGGDGLRLYKSDGSDAGTVIVDPTEFLLARDFRAFGSTLYFAGVGTTDNDRNLWRSEGTDATTFAITDKFAHFDGLRLQYAFLPGNANDPPVQHFNTGTTVNEGAGATILNAQLDFDDAQESDAQITYTLTSLTANGTLFRNAIALGLGGTFTQADVVGNLLTYTHNGSETVSDAFGFSVSDGVNPAVTGQTFAITVTPQNDPPVQHFNTGTTVNEGASTTILNAQLDFDDPDNTNAQITYTVTALPANGTLFRNAVALGVGGTFTQADLVGNLLSYTHSGSETTSDAFGFSLSDGIAPAITGQTFAITVTPQNDPPVQHFNTGTTVNEGASTTFLNAQLDFDDPDNTNAQITYTVTALPANGTLFRNAVALGTGGTFTQADIVGNLLSYTHSGSETTSDAFGFSLSDGIAPAITGQTFAITVTPQNDPPVITSNGGGAMASISILENATAVTTATATDPDGPSLAFSIVGGDDAAKFQINTSTGALSFITAPNFEAPSDLDHNNSYLVQVRASDGSLSDDQLITVNVTDIPEVLHWAKSVDAGTHPDPNPDAHAFLRGLGGPLSPGWLPVGIGDFNNDATSDLAWYNPGTNGIDIWKLANGSWAGSASPGSHPAGYQPAGVGDFNHDGTSDLLWFNPTTRDLDLWKISNGGWAGSVDIGLHPAGYLPSGVGDFNGDGTSDVLWYNATTRDAEIWTISNGQWAGSSDVGIHPAGYQPSLIGDFDGDGTSDIGWYNAATGNLDIWKIQNGQWAGSVNTGNHPAGWQPLGAADFDTDGTADIAWYNPATNNIDIWLIKNAQWAGSVNIGSHPAGSIAVGVGDFDHSGVNDVMWLNPATGQIENWLLEYS